MNSKEKRREGARHMDSKFKAQAQAKADKSPCFHPDRKGRGTGHVALLKRAITHRAAAHLIAPAEYRSLIGWDVI